MKFPCTPMNIALIVMPIGLGILACLLLPLFPAMVVDKPLRYEKIIYNTSDKPTAPIDVDIRFQQAPVAGQKAKVIFSANSQVFAEDVELNISTPSDVPVQSGNNKWHGSLHKGSPQNVEMECTIPDNKRREIIATATIIYGKARLVKVVSLIVGTEDDPAKPKPPSGVIKKNERGDDIIEFKD